MERDISWEMTHEAQQTEYWRSNLDDIQSRLSDTNDAHQIQQIREEELPELLEEFPYVGEAVFVMGPGVVPIINEEHQIVGQQWTENNETLGLHYGFDIVSMAVNGISSAVEHRVTHKIFISGGEYMSGLDVVERQFQVFAHQDCQKSAFLPLDKVNSLFYVFNDETIEKNPIGSRIDSLNNYSKQFIQMLGSTAFRRFTRQKQKRSVDEFLGTVEADLQLRQLEVDLEPSYVYVPYLTEMQGKPVRGFIPILTDKTIISGECLGVDSIETGRLHQKAIRSDQDLADKTAGLCLVVDPDPDTRAYYQLNANQTMYIPTRDQSFDIAFSD